MMYAQQPFHHEDYCWDGQVIVRKGKIVRCSLLNIRGPWTPCWENEFPLDKPMWHWRADDAGHRFGGVLFEVEGGMDAVVMVYTRSAEMQFTVGEITEKKIIRKHVGPHYSCVELTALLDGYDPNLDEFEYSPMNTNKDRPWRAFIGPSSIKGPVHRWNRTDWVWIAPGQSAEITVKQPAWKKRHEGTQRYVSAVFRCNAAVPDREGQKPEEVEQFGKNTSLLYKVFLNEHHISDGWQPFWDQYLHPMMEEFAVELPQDLFKSGQNIIRLQNEDGQRDYLLLGRVYLEEAEKRDFEVSLCPAWVALGDEFEIEIRCRAVQRHVNVELPSGLLLLDDVPAELGAGTYRFTFKAEEAFANLRIKFSSENSFCEAIIEQVVAVEKDPVPMRVGMETCALPWRHTGYIEQCLRFLVDTQIGDLCIFRRVRDENHARSLAALCRKLGIYHMMCHSVPPRWTIAASREGEPYFSGWMLTEMDGPLFGYDIAPVGVEIPEAERTMRTAYEAYVAFRKRLFAMVKQHDPAVKAVDMITVIGHSHAYAAGVDMCVAQFNKMHNVLLLADARGAARAYKKAVWGTYIAEGAHKHPEGDDTLRMWWLALHLSYICGSSFANDEESVLRNYHERLYSQGDRFPRTRQEILREFNRFVKSHPRSGELQVKQALLIGRYACDVADGLSDSRREGLPPMVWRFCGANTPEWLPSTPEYGWRYLDVFFPGVWLHSLVQSPRRVRRWYSGTPYGELELIPIEASINVWKQFKLLLLLGWNTMEKGTYQRIKKYVQNGGVIFMSIPHLSTNESRQLQVNRTEPLNLLQDGDFSDVFGVKASGIAGRLSDLETIMCDERAPMADRKYKFATEIGPAVVPKHPPVHLVSVELCGAEVLIRDEATNQPLLVRNRVGKGEAYLLLTHDFPGHSSLSPLMTDLMHELAKNVPAEVELEDATGDVYYTVRTEKDTGLVRVHLLNTDWTEACNSRLCRLRLGEKWLSVSVDEGRLTEVIKAEKLVILVQDGRTFVEKVSSSERHDSIELHGFGKGEIFLQGNDDTSLGNIQFMEESLTCTTSDGWTIATFNFGSHSSGELIVEMKPQKEKKSS